MPPKLTVAIVGAGLSGLLFAVALQKCAPDVAFEIYESTSELTEIGAGISMHRRTWAVMKAIGLEETLRKITGTSDKDRPAVAQIYRKSDQPEGFAFSSVQMDEASYTFHRGELQKAFLDHLQSGPQAINLKKRFVAYTQPEGGSGKIQVRFQDGATAECDVLVGADGIRSTVRDAMYTRFAETAQAAGRNDEAAELKSNIPAVYSGASVFRTLIQKDTLPKEAAGHPALNIPGMILYGGKNRHLVTYPISQGQILNAGAIIGQWERQGELYPGPWVSAVTRDEVVERFSDFEPDVQELLKHMNGFSKWAINVVPKLPTYVDGRVVLMGDAAHAMAPFLGAGAGQCFEDAYLLAQFLGRPSVHAENLHVALRLYDEIRRPVCQNIAERSLRTGRVVQYATPELEYLSEEQSATGKALTLEQLQDIARQYKELNSWETTTAFMDNNEASLRRLDKALSG